MPARNVILVGFMGAGKSVCGRLLAKLMATGLRPGARVIELGAGTGTVTQALLDSGVRREDLYLVERDRHFLGILARRFPHCPLVATDALSLADHFGPAERSFDFVISGLPLLLFSPEQRLRLIEQVFAVLRPNESTPDGRQVGEGFFNSLTSSQNYGAQFANKISVTCP